MNISLIRRPKNDEKCVELREVFEATQANCQPHWSLDSDVVTFITYLDYHEDSTFILHSFRS